MPLPSEPADRDLPSAGESGEAIARRKLLQQAGWVIPAIVSTVTVSARAAQATCTPTCRPVTCNPRQCGPNNPSCGPASCRPRS